MNKLDKPIRLLYRKNNIIVTTTMREIATKSGLEANEFAILRALNELSKERIIEILEKNVVNA